MGSDYHMQEIAKWETIAGVEVPIDKWGHYLNWNEVQPAHTKRVARTREPNKEELEWWRNLGETRLPCPRQAYRKNVTTPAKARDLTSPYGVLHFAIGNAEGDEQCDGDFTTFFDYAELPDGRIILHSVCNTESGGYIGGGEYNITFRDEAVQEAQAMTSNAMQAVAYNEVRHDEEGWNQSSCYFWRCVHAFIAQNGPAIRIPILRRGLAH